MALTLVQSKSINARATSTSLAFTSAPAAGNLLIAVVCCSAGGTTMAAPTTTGQTWTGLGLVNNGGTQVQVFYIANWAGSGAPTVSATSTSSRDIELIIAEFSGAATSTPVDTSLTGTTTTITLSTAAANELLIGAISANSSTAFTAGTGMTLVQDKAADQGAGAVVWKTATSAGSNTASFGGGSGTFAIQAVAFKIPGGGGPVTVSSLMMVGC